MNCQGKLLFKTVSNDVNTHSLIVMTSRISGPLSNRVFQFVFCFFLDKFKRVLNITEATPTSELTSEDLTAHIKHHISNH